MSDKEFIESYFKGKDLGVTVAHGGQLHYFTQEALLDCTLASKPDVHKFVAKVLKTGSKKAIKELMMSIAETVLKENMVG